MVLATFLCLYPNKSEKVRIAFDAAAEYGEPSLNDNLLQGPDVISNPVGVLFCRFQQDDAVIVTDIESVFHQVKVREQDQDSLRFLWWNGSTDDTPGEYVMTVHILEATDSFCIANPMLKKTVDDNENHFDLITLKTLRHNCFFLTWMTLCEQYPRHIQKLNCRMEKF